VLSILSIVHIPEIDLLIQHTRANRRGPIPLWNDKPLLDAVDTVVTLERSLDIVGKIAEHVPPERNGSGVCRYLVEFPIAVKPLDHISSEPIAQPLPAESFGDKEFGKFVASVGIVQMHEGQRDELRFAAHPERPPCIHVPPIRIEPWIFIDTIARRPARKHCMFGKVGLKVPGQGILVRDRDKVYAMVGHASCSQDSAGTLITPVSGTGFRPASTVLP
jgi:hypothetical protein